MRRPAILAALACLLMLSACSPGANGAKAKPDAGAAFLARNAKLPGVITLPDGVQYKVLRSGPAGGVKPAAADEVKVNYELRLIDGKVVQSSWDTGQPMSRPLNSLIPAWTEAVQMMKPGDIWELYVPAKLGYGEQGQGNDIPPNSTLIFKIELIDVLPTGNLANG